MTVKVAFIPLSLDDSESRDAVKETTLKNIYAFAPALYEACWDDAAEGASSQRYQGHDHTEEGGGGPLIRGLCLSEHGGDDYLYQLDFTEAGQRLEISQQANSNRRVVRGGNYTYPVSPMLGGVLEGWFLYTGANSTFFVEMGFGADPIEVEGDTGETPRKVPFSVPLKPGEMNKLSMYVRCDEYDPENPPQFTLYAIYLSETRNSYGSRPPALQVPPSAGVGVVKAGHMTLAQELVEDQLFLDSDALLRPSAMLNATYEGIEDAPAPGASSQTIAGHDHDPLGWGGRALGRNVIYRAGCGGGTMFSSSIGSASSYQRVDDGGLRESDGEAMFEAPVSPGLTSSGSPPTTAPYLTAEIYLVTDPDATSGATVLLRMRNRTTGNYSAVTTLGPGIVKNGRFAIDKIPCQPGWNLMDLEISCSVDSTTIYVNQVVIYENTARGGGGRSASSGTYKP